MDTHADNRYVQALRQGDFSVLDGLYAAHAPAVGRWIRQNSGSMADAKDVFQEAVVAFYQKAADPDFRLTCPVGGLLFQMCRNIWLNQLRKKKREEEVSRMDMLQYEHEGPVEDTLVAVEEEAIRQKRLDATFAQLSDLCQKLLRLLAAGMSSTQVAESLDMSNTNTVYRRKNACMARWRDLYHDANA